MQNVVLERLETSLQGTFGRIQISGKHFFTGELPFKGNTNNSSCIYDGLYHCSYTYSPRFKRFTYLLMGVKGRDSIRIHPANLMGSLSDGYKAQLNGCIALGEKLGFIEKQKAILLSSPAVRIFEEIMERKPFVLEIKA